MTTSGGFPPPGPAPAGPAGPQDNQRYGAEPPAGRKPTAPPGTPPPGGWAPPAGGTPTAPTPRGPAGGWAPPPQTRLLTAHKPGIIPLHPLGVGAILDGAVKAVRHNPTSMIGLSALVMALFLIPSAAISAWVTTLLSDGLTADEAAVALPMVGTTSEALFTQGATVILSGLLIYVVGEAVLGRKPGIGQTWRATRGRLLPLIGLNLLLGMGFLVLTGLLVGPGLLLLANGSPVLGALLVLMGGFGLVALAVLLAVRTSLAGPVLVLEKRGVATALRRSWSLTRGAFWRLLGISLLGGLIAGLVGSLLRLPFSIAGMLVVSITGDIGQGAIAGTFISHVAALLAGAITTPFAAAVTGLLYIDRRMRVEALDVALVRAAQSGDAPRS